MSCVKVLRTLAISALFSGLVVQSGRAQSVKKVFVIAMENHNWIQPDQFSGEIQQIFQNPNAPFINSLVNGTATAVINGSAVTISKQVSYTTAYHNALATPSGSNLSIHPFRAQFTSGRRPVRISVFSTTTIRTCLRAAQIRTRTSI